MNRKISYFAAVALAMGLCCAPVAGAASMATVVLYAGSTQATNDASLTPVDLSNPSFQNGTWHHYFDFLANFNPANSGEDFSAAILNVTYGSGIVPITKAGVSGGTANKWFPNNPTSPSAGVNTFGTNQDGGTLGDVQGITIIQSDPGVALSTQVGETGGELGRPSKFGRVGFAFTGPLTADTFVGIQPGSGQVFSYFTGNDAGAGTTVTQATGITGSSYAIAAAVPEPGVLPATASLVGISLLGMRARRRRLA